MWYGGGLPPSPHKYPPGFASGGLHAGGWRIVGERGPELELTGPSRIISNADTKRMLGGMNGDMGMKLEQVRMAIEQLGERLDPLLYEQLKANLAAARVLTGWDKTELPPIRESS